MTQTHTADALEALAELEPERGPHDLELVTRGGKRIVRCRFWVCGAPTPLGEECPCCGAVSAQTGRGIQLIRSASAVAYRNAAAKVDQWLRQAHPGAMVRQTRSRPCASCGSAAVLMLDSVDLTEGSAIYDARCGCGWADSLSLPIGS